MKNKGIKLLITAVLMSCVVGVQAQEQASPLQQVMDGLSVRNIGPAGMSGRVTCITVHPQIPTTIYAGSASGGLWVSANNGQSWSPLFQNEKVASIGAIAIDPTHPDIIYVGTGEGNPRNSQTSGYGLYKSYDGGQSWECLGLEETRTIHRILINPSNTDEIYVGATGSAWGDSPRGVYKSTDGGKNWTQSLYIDGKTGAGDLVMDPNNPKKLIANMWEYRRAPWFFTSGGPSGGLFITYDGGEHWKKLGEEDGLPKGNLGRIGLGIAPSNSNIVYALVETEKKNGVYKSTNGGKNWFKVTESEQAGNRPFYYADLRVDPQNPDRVYSLWTYVTRSDDGGKNWKTITPYNRIHPDHHAMWINPANPAHIIEGNDGGMNISYDYGETWHFVENLPLAQFYHINVDDQLPYNVYGGMQDNGSWKGPAYSLTVDGIRNEEWSELFFGDGFDVVPVPGRTDAVYAQSQEGNVGLVNAETGYSELIKPAHPEGEKLRWHWNAPIALDPHAPETSLYFGSQFLHKSTDNGKNWTIISPDLTSNNPEKQKQLESGGLTYDVTGAENHTCLLAIAPSALDQNVIWAGSDDGKLHVTMDGGANWVDLSKKLKGLPEGSWIPQIRASDYDKGTAWVVANDYRRNNWSAYLFKIEEFGKKVTRVVDDSDIFGPILSVWQDPVEPNLLFVGGEYGLYVSVDGGASYTKWTDAVPTAQIMDLAFQAREKDLVLGTFGRGAWVIDDIEPLRVFAAGNGLSTPTFFEPPTAYQWERRQSPGVRFAGMSTFRGENRRFGARMTVYLPEVAEDNKKKLRVDYQNEGGDTIYTQYILVKEAGLQNWRWAMWEKGTEYPEFKVRKEEKEQSDRRGAPVLPGTYTVTMNWDGQTASKPLKVEYDYRMSSWVSEDDLIARRKAFKAIEGIEADLDLAVQSLAQANENIERLQALLKREPYASDSALVDTVKATAKALEAARHHVFGKKETKGYFEQPEVWSSQWGSSLWQLLSSSRAWGSNEQALFDQLSKRTDEAAQTVMTFLIEDYNGLLEYLEEHPVDIMVPTDIEEEIRK
ncbi:hypothetical protein OAM98_05030 [Schleiferiaceae bacterium]|nr:hypothetical protein [Schleiferiaceae bacterium]